MSVLFFDGADHYLHFTTSGGNVNGIVQKWGTITSTNAPSTVSTGRNGGRSIRMIGNQGIGRVVNQAGSNTRKYIVGFALVKDVPGTLPSSNNSIFKFKTGVTDQLSLCFDTSGRLNLRRGSQAGTLLATTTALPSNFFDSYHHVGIEAVINSSGGSVEVYIDGNTTTWDTVSTDLSGITNTGTSAGMTTVSIECNNSFDGWQVDDFYCIDNVDRSTDATPDLTAFPGDLRATVMMAASAVDTGNYKQWTPSTGSNHAAMVDDPTSSSPCPNGDTDYVGAPGTGLRDSFVLSSISGIIDPLAIQIIHSSRSDGTARNISTFCRQGTTDYDNAAQSVGATNYDMYRDILERNPKTTAPWVLADVNPPTEYGVLS